MKHVVPSSLSSTHVLLRQADVYSTMCQGSIPGLTLEQNTAKRWAIPVLVLSIFTLIGWIYLLWASGLAGVCGCVAASLLLCCGPTTSGIGEAGKYSAAAALAITTAVIDGIAAIWNLVLAVAIFVSDDDYYEYYVGWGIFMLFIMGCNIASLALHVVFAKKCVQAKRSLTAAAGATAATANVVAAPTVQVPVAVVVAQPATAAGSSMPTVTAVVPGKV